MRIIIVGSGISGMSAAVCAAESGMSVELLSSYSSERSQSVMAAGGINAALDTLGEGDSTACHAWDTLKGGCFLENESDVMDFCDKAPDDLRWLEGMGVVFNRDKDQNLSLRAFGGQTFRRTAFAGASTGKQIVTALVQKCREYEIKGSIKRRIGLFFHSALIKDGKCYGVLMVSAITSTVLTFYGDAVVMASGGQNKLFGKTTGTEICDGYAVGRLFAQGIRLRNLEFVQYHPTTIETSHKKMLITEAARGEGGRLYYMKDGRHCYFMEEMYGAKGNLMPRDIVSKCMYDCHSQVYLDITFLGEEFIHERLQEVYDLCLEYIGLDVTKESIPVAPSVHFFMGGIAVDRCHETNIRDLYAIGECASMYHGANRLGGNSLLAAVHSGRTAAKSIYARGEACLSGDPDVYAGSYERGNDKPDIYDKIPVDAYYDKESAAQGIFEDYIENVQSELRCIKDSESLYPADYILKEIALIMNRDLGITRDEKSLAEGLENIEYYLEVIGKLRYDSSISIYENYRLYYMALLAKAIILSAIGRRETRGSHIRTDYPETLEEYRKCSYAMFRDGEIEVVFGEES